jgi:hypothetical protein
MPAIRSDSRMNTDAHETSVLLIPHTLSYSRVDLLEQHQAGIDSVAISSKDHSGSDTTAHHSVLSKGTKRPPAKEANALSLEISNDFDRESLAARVGFEPPCCHARAVNEVTVLQT